MQSKILSKRLLSIAGVVATISGAIAIFFTTLSPAIQGSYTQPILSVNNPILKAKLGETSLPIRLKITRIHLDVAIESVGLTSIGAMGVPKNFMHTAWFNLGPRPWQEGSAVIDGHFGFINRKPGAFNNLSKLRKGDVLSIQDGKGIITTFVVRESRTYRPDEDVPSVFDSSDGKAHLNLITCQGIWNKSSKSYSERLVVFTDKQEKK